MTESFSSAAQAVLDAATSVCHPETEVVAFQCTRLEVAAALRAAADQVVPDAANYLRAAINSVDWWDAHDQIRAELLAIAAELEVRM
jgi:hypothetical protein